MWESITLKDHPEVKRVVLAAFPSYRKLKATLSAFNGGININSYWDGGTRNEYSIVELATLQRKSLPTRTHPFYDVAVKGLCGAENEVVSVDHVGNITLKVLPEGFALVEAGTFCGKPATAHIYLNPSNMTKLLPGRTAN